MGTHSQQRSLPGTLAEEGALLVVTICPLHGQSSSVLNVRQQTHCLLMLTVSFLTYVLCGVFCCCCFSAGQRVGVRGDWMAIEPERFRVSYQL